jgi:hypothetical protein
LLCELKVNIVTRLIKPQHGVKRYLAWRGTLCQHYYRFVERNEQCLRCTIVFWVGASEGFASLSSPFSSSDVSQTKMQWVEEKENKKSQSHVKSFAGKKFAGDRSVNRTTTWLSFTWAQFFWSFWTA